MARPGHFNGTFEYHFPVLKLDWVDSTALYTSPGMFILKTTSGWKRYCGRLRPAKVEVKEGDVWVDLE
jgi:hypothetical protein